MINKVTGGLNCLRTPSNHECVDLISSCTFLMRPICLCRATKADVVERFLDDVTDTVADRVSIAVRQLDMLILEIYGVFHNSIC